jgi:hypothetical protein
VPANGVRSARHKIGGRRRRCCQVGHGALTDWIDNRSVQVNCPVRRKEKNFCFFFIHFSMNAQVGIKSRKIARDVKKYETFSKDRLGHLEQISC